MSYQILPTTLGCLSSFSSPVSVCVGWEGGSSVVVVSKMELPTDYRVHRTLIKQVGQLRSHWSMVNWLVATKGAYKYASTAEGKCLHWLNETSVIKLPFSSSVLPSRCPQRKTVTAPTRVSLTASMGHHQEAGLRSWMNMDTHSMSLSTHRRRCSLLINHEAYRMITVVQEEEFKLIV